VLKDKSAAELADYYGQVELPGDFDAFWEETIAQSRAKAQPPVLELVEQTPVLDIFDLTFSGFDGEPIKGWVRVPKGVDKAAVVVSYVGYNGGRGHWLENLTWASLGFVSVQMDSRGQGSGWSLGDTPDPHGSGPQIPGVMTKGISSREDYYYRRLLTDAVLCADAAASLKWSNGLLFTVGDSQGGLMSLTAAALSDKVTRSFAAVPYMCDIRHAVETTEDRPFAEISDYLGVHRTEVEAVYKVLGYFDGVNFARKAKVPVFMTVGMEDSVVPASTVFAAYNNCPTRKRLQVWTHNGHESGEIYDVVLAREFFEA
jgi:cephalosporin-C deacetylase